MTHCKNQTQTHARRRAFTLVELLVVVVIITILAGIVLTAMFGATESARVARTRAMVARVNDLIAPIWEAYNTRRVPISIPATDGPAVAAGKRLNALRELMRMELPDRITDVVDDPVTVGKRPALSEAYKRMVTARAGGFPGTWTEANEGSECLYMILSRIQNGNTNGLEFVRETEIGDTDSDGMPEILDAWGKPIAFLRWAPGFLAPNSTVQDGTKADPFDPLQVGTGNFFLRPLVFSAGPDQTYDVSAQSAGFQYSTTSPPNDPFTTTVSPAFGTPDTTSGKFRDNIHNHFISTGIN